MNEDIIMIVSGWKEMLEKQEEIPHRMFMDLMVCFYVMQKTGKYGHEVDLTLLSYEEAERRGLSDPEKLFEAALKNTVRHFPLCIKDYGEGMYVVTNEKGIFGATAMLYPDSLEKTAEKIGGDMVVVPLSIHEVVCLPADKADPDIIHDMLMESIMEREQEDSQENVLSSTIYYYDSVRKHISILVSGGDMVQ